MQRDYTNARCICDWGVHHPINVVCKCEHSYGPAFKMKEWLKDKYPIEYSADITQTMRDHYILEGNPRIYSDKHVYMTATVTAQRNAWTVNKLQQLSKEELEGFKQQVIDMYPTAYAQGRIRPKLLKQFAYILIRRKYGCPYG